MDVYKNFIIRRLQDIEKAVRYKNKKYKKIHVIQISVQKKLIRKALDIELEQHSDYVMELSNIIRNNYLFKNSVIYSINSKNNMRDVTLSIKPNKLTRNDNDKVLQYVINIRDVDFGFEYISKTDDWYKSSEVI